MREGQWQGNHPSVEKGLKRQGLKDRLICTVFGKVRYWRTYIYRGKNEGGYYPLDIELGLPWERVQHVGPKLCGSACDQNELCPVCGDIKYVFTMVSLSEDRRGDGAGSWETYGSVV